MDQGRAIFLFTDFSWSGPYVGQMISAIQRLAPACPVTNLMHDAPAMRPDLAAYLLAACCKHLPIESTVVAVVDPGVGGERSPLVVETNEGLFVGPDNGLLSRVPGIQRVARIDWRPVELSSSFHGRDLFAPVAAKLSTGCAVATTPLTRDQMIGADWPDQTATIVFVDGYGNLMTGLRARQFDKTRQLRADGQVIGFAETFCRVQSGDLFWHENSQGLVEIAANGVSASDRLSLALGDKILLD